MIATPTNTKEEISSTKIDEFKSAEGVRFKAKLMGNTIVEELRGKIAAENAMAKLKLNIMKQKQHKTRVNISLKWDGFYVYLSDGGQELLHTFPHENISFVWKDSCDNRALGIICTDISSDKQVMSTKFYGYKTEKPALPLIMSLKELFGLRANEYNEVVDEKTVTKEEDHKKEDSTDSPENLLDLKDDLVKELNDNYVNPYPQPTDNTSKWTSFSNVNLFSSFPPATSFPPCIPTVNSMAPQWQQYPVPGIMSSNQIWATSNPTGLVQYSNPFSPPVMYSQPINFNTNIQNPFRPLMTNPPTTNAQPQITKIAQPKISKNHIDDLFSDLLTSDYCMNLSILPPLKSSNPNGKESGKVTLIEMKNSQEIMEPMDFSLFDKKQTNPNNKLPSESNSMPIYTLKFD